MRRSQRLKDMAARRTVPEPGVTSAVPGEWNYLPPEVMQEKVLKKLNARNDLLKCRQVCSAWKVVVDKTLEKEALSLWTEWFSFDGRLQTQPPHIPKMDLLPTTRSFTWNHSSLPSTRNLRLGSPFPTNSMKITMHRNATAFEKREAMVKQLSVNYGQYLTSFVLSKFRVDFKFLSGILGPLINLKALTLQKVAPMHELVPLKNRCMSLRKGSLGHRKLPPLPNLAYLKIFDCVKRVSDLFIYSYSEQLVHLEAGLWSKPCCRPVKFTNLKRLKLSADFHTQMRIFPEVEPSLFPSLEYYSEIHLNQPYGWDELLRAIENLPKTLLHLNLHLLNSDIDKFSSKEFKPESLTSIFPLLKTLAIPFPRNTGQAERIRRWLLAKFPNLETVHLLNYTYEKWFSSVDHSHRFCVDVNREVIHQLITSAGFWTECKKLKKIILHMECQPMSFLELVRD
ncbi:hypothetical protein Ocin01_12706 [Orchesella cincta]|uniref:F-box domain-containing protein n=1 Tax=Orchesella cincta TaxID=48709 RepID=A0A1D2MLQ4_ORCCI|nr:hypothetical protein Ocin01_12706 [Orchesella cincta]